MLRIGVMSFDCTAVGQSESRWLVVDLEMRCDVGPQLAYAASVALPMLILYGVCVPVGAMAFLRSYGHLRLTDPSVMFRWGLLHSGYREQKFWWEIVVLARKYTLIFLATLATEDIYQLWAGLAVFVVAMHLHDTQRPYGGDGRRAHHHHRRHRQEEGEQEGEQERPKQEKEKDQSAKRMLHQYENLSLIILLFLLWAGMFFMLNLCQDSTRVWCTVLVVCVLVTNVLFVIATVGRCCREFYKRNQGKLRGVVKAVKGVANNGRASVLGRKKRRAGESLRPEAMPAVAIIHVAGEHKDAAGLGVEMTTKERRNTSVTL